MDYKNIIALDVELNLDYNRIANELLSLTDDVWTHQTTPNNDCQWKTLSLTTNDIQPFNGFKSSKTLNHLDWNWDLKINIPYTKSIIDSLPIDTLGIVHVIFTDGPIPMHTDTDQNTPDDETYYLGLSLFPILNDPLTIHNLSIYSRSMFFNDMYPHGYPVSESKNLIIRIFGKFRYNEFKIKQKFLIE